MYAVCVTFRIVPGGMETFLPLMRANDRASLEGEAGCHQFDVCREGDEVFLYELYTDRAAFDAHLGTAHFRDFDRAAGPLIAQKDVKTYDWRRGGDESD